MTLPSRSELPEPIKKKTEYSPEVAKMLIEDATLMAIMTFKQTLESETATPGEKLRAAEKIIEMGHGKNSDALTIVQTKQDAGKLVADAIRQARIPSQPIPTDSSERSKPVLPDTDSGEAV